MVVDAGVSVVTRLGAAPLPVPAGGEVGGCTDGDGEFWGDAETVGKAVGSNLVGSRVGVGTGVPVGLGGALLTVSVGDGGVGEGIATGVFVGCGVALLAGSVDGGVVGERVATGVSYNVPYKVDTAS